MIELTGRYASLDAACSEIILVLDIFQDPPTMRVVYKGRNNLATICNNVALPVISMNFIFSFDSIPFDRY